jgi:hypothetical protein
MGISRIFEIIFLRKIPWYRSMDRWAGSTAFGSQVYGSLIQRGTFNARWTHEIRTRKVMFSCRRK